MNKQKLASKIWESANKLRSKIEANEYKDYILGFIFYKFLSDKEERFLRKDGWGDNDFKNLVEEDFGTVEYCQRQLGYFISYNNLFSTWLNKGKNFSVSDVTDALSAFNRLIDTKHKKVFEKIFDTLDTGLPKLGDTSGTRTKAISNLLHLIKDIPMDGKADYDVLGFIYEYLISHFAANAGKKAGEFYTPHEVSLLMSEIVANHLRYKEKNVFDELPDIQYKILCESSKYLKPGGILIYSTCTLYKKENEENVKRFLNAHPEFSLYDFKSDNISSENGMLTLRPDIHETDGFFIARFRKKDLL